MVVFEVFREIGLEDDCRLVEETLGTLVTLVTLVTFLLLVLESPSDDFLVGFKETLLVDVVGFSLDWLDVEEDDDDVFLVVFPFITLVDIVKARSLCSKIEKLGDG